MNYLDLELLESFIAIAETGSFTRASARLHKTQSTVSQQLKRLEERIGAPLLHRNTRTVSLSERGELLLGYSRRLIELHNQTLHSISNTFVEGRIRIGSAQDIADGGLENLLAHFTRLYPLLQIEVRVDANLRLRDAIKHGELDLAIVLQEPGEGGDVIDRMKRVWVAATGFQHQETEPLPLVVCESPCIFRSIALAALDREEIPWRIALTTPSLAGMRAAIRAGLGVSVRPERWLEPGLQEVASNLPSLPDIEIAILSNPTIENSSCEQLREGLYQEIKKADFFRSIG